MESGRYTLAAQPQVRPALMTHLSSPEEHTSFLSKTTNLSLLYRRWWSSVRAGKSIKDGWAVIPSTASEYHCAKWLSTTCTRCVRD